MIYLYRAYIIIVVLFSCVSGFSQNYLDTLLDYNGINEQAFNMLYINDSVIQINSASSNSFNDFESGVLIRQINLSSLNIITNNFSYGQVSLPLGGENGSVKKENSDTTFIVYSPYDSSPNNADSFLAALFNADTLWTKNLGIDNRTDYLLSIDCLEDSLLVLAGSAKNDLNFHDFRFIVTDMSGNILTESTFGGSGDDLGWNLSRLTDSTYLVSGFTRSENLGITGISDFYLVEFSLTGDVLWSHNYCDFDRVGGSAEVTSDGNIMVYGFALNDFDSAQSYYAKLDYFGNIIWEKTIDNDVYNVQEFQSFQETLDGYVFIGSCPDKENQEQVGNIVKTDFDGNVLWDRKYKRRENGNYFRDILPTDDNGFYVLGFVYPDVIDPNITTDTWLLELNCLGFKAPPKSEFTADLDNNYTVQFTNESMNFGTCKYIYGDGQEETFTENDPKISSHTYSDNGTYEVTLITYGCNSESDTVSYWVNPSVLAIEEIVNEDSFSVYPNPSKDFITIKHALKNSEIEIIDAKGRIVKYLKSEQNKEMIDVSDLEKGLYFVKLSNQSSEALKRFVVL